MTFYERSRPRLHLFLYGELGQNEANNLHKSCTVCLTEGVGITEKACVSPTYLSMYEWNMYDEKQSAINGRKES